MVLLYFLKFKAGKAIHLYTYIPIYLRDFRCKVSKENRTKVRGA